MLMKRIGTFSKSIIFLAMISSVASPLLFAHAQSADNTQIRIWISWDAPPDFQDMLAPLFAMQRYQQVLNRDSADLQVDFQGSGGAITSRWVYVPVVPFTSFAQSVKYVDMQRFWNGDPNALNTLSPDDTPMTLVLTNSVFTAMQVFMGQPVTGASIQIVPGDALVAQLWQQHPHAVSMVAFSDLSPTLRPLVVDGMDIFDEGLDLQHYPFTAQVGITGKDWAVGQAIDDLLLAGSWKGTNRDLSQLTRLVLSGVTALTRATAYAMEANGITTPGLGIMPFVQDADFLHTSNEVPFSVQCPSPDPYGGTVFCAADSYLELLKYIGLDVVELTGNHINDYGPGAFKHTLELYDEAGMKYFGGGRTPDEAKAPLILENNGNTIAFIGCNVPGPFKAWASDERPGAAQCDDAYLQETLAQLASEVDIVIMTVQEFEYYRYTPPNSQIARFTNYATWGADVVIGSQAHQPQGFGYVERAGQNPAFLHHGLGNLFFDQMAQLETRQMFMDKLYIHDGKLLAVDLFTGIIDNYCCPREMTSEERFSFLQTIFAASGW
jgi:hypothetical protein